MTAKTTRRLLAGVVLALFGLAGEAAGQEPAAGPDAEEGAEFARRAALSALHGPPRLFLDSIDADGILRRLLGDPVWLGLTARQRGMLRTAVREQFGQALSPGSGASAEIVWSSATQTGRGPVSVCLGLRYGASVLKTQWTLERAPGGFIVEDIELADPGLSLAGEVGRMLGPEPVRPRDTAREARERALPRLAGLGAIAAIVLLFSKRLARDRRPILWLTASVPALLFAVDGVLAVRRALSEPYALVETLPAQRWRQLEKLALEAQAQGNGEQARAAWGKALEAGAPAAPVYFQMGLAAQSRGAGDEAAQDFRRALEQRPPAPGAGRELAGIAIASQRYEDALALLQSYLRATCPDPDSLATLAVVQTNLGNSAAAVETIRAARGLVGESWRKVELEAQIYARSGDAAGAVAALRALEPEGKLDRASLRADPAYLPIATDPAWVSFLAEKQEQATSEK